jgi:ATP-dependent exoDNAse (exonuclease V) beta subunit
MEEDVSLAAARLFARESRDIVAFGTEIHRLLEGVGWAEDLDCDAVVEMWRRAASSAPHVLDDVERQFRKLFACPEAVAALSKPDGPCTLWREKRFEVVLPGHRWVSGTFDRVVILGRSIRDAQGAVILDYKSSLVETENDMRRRVDTYAPQLMLYSQVLARMTALPQERIACRILFTRNGAVRDVPFPG